MAERVGATLWPGAVVAYTGGLGAGKTAFTRGLARGLGIADPVTSPTYTIVNEYEGGRLTLYHIDAYRLSGPDEFELMDSAAYLYSGGVCAVEWSERVAAALPPDALRIDIEPIEGELRRIRVYGQALEERLR